MLGEGSPPPQGWDWSDLWLLQSTPWSSKVSTAQRRNLIENLKGRFWNHKRKGEVTSERTLWPTSPSQRKKQRSYWLHARKALWRRTWPSLEKYWIKLELGGKNKEVSQKDPGGRISAVKDTLPLLLIFQLHIIPSKQYLIVNILNARYLPDKESESEDDMAYVSRLEFTWR